MKTRELLIEQIEREREFLAKQEVGTERYNASLTRLMELEDKLSCLDNTKTKNILEGVKVASSIALPLIGLIGITAFEKNDSFTSALKGYVQCFIPKKGS